MLKKICSFFWEIKLAEFNSNNNIISIPVALLPFQPQSKRSVLIVLFTLLHLLVSKHTVIVILWAVFYCTAHYASFLSFPVGMINLRDIIILPTSLFWPLLQVMDLCFFPLIYGLHASHLGYKSMDFRICNLQCRPWTWLVRGV